MRHQFGSLLRTIATGLVLAAERIDPQPAKPDPGSFQVHTAAGTTTYEPRLIWLGRMQDTC